MVDTIAAMLAGKVKVFVGLGGNFSTATPDTPRTHAAMRQCNLTVHIATKLNRSHLVHGRDALILPTLGRTEIDMQNGVAQGVTVEDSVCMVHISYGMNQPASPHLLSEIAIVARMADATLGSKTIDWLWYAQDYARIRNAIEKVIPGFEDYNARIAVPGGFHLTPPARDRIAGSACRIPRPRRDRGTATDGVRSDGSARRCRRCCSAPSSPRSATSSSSRRPS